VDLKELCLGSLAQPAQGFSPKLGEPEQLVRKVVTVKRLIFNSFKDDPHLKTVKIIS